MTSKERAWCSLALVAMPVSLEYLPNHSSCVWDPPGPLKGAGPGAEPEGVAAVGTAESVYSPPPAYTEWVELSSWKPQAED